MKSPPQQHQHVHPEVVNLKDQRPSEEEDEDPDELCDHDASDHKGSHVGQWWVSTLSACGQAAGAEPMNSVGAEFNSNTNGLKKYIIINHADINLYTM